jgi:hypothetical protein
MAQRDDTALVVVEDGGEREAWAPPFPVALSWQAVLAMVQRRRPRPALAGRPANQQETNDV